MSVTKAELINRVYSKLDDDTSKRDAARLVELAFEIMKDAICNDGKLKISGFGNFEVRGKGERMGRNPKTGDSMVITPRRVVTFKPSPVLRRKLNPDRGQA